MSHSEHLVAERYRLVSQIGSGGMGRVWLARDEVLRRDVAVKEVVLPLEMSFEERNELCRRTLREARAAGRLSHPHVVAVYDVVQAAGRPWIVMEYVRSRSLYQVIKEDGPLPPRRVAEIGLAVLVALRAAHQAGVWHRDVKPGNVLLADDGRVVLTDFGLATLDGGDGTVTRSGVILGSAQYISPERAREGASGPESDMWSLGATLYAAVEGRSPFARETSMATLTALATMPPDPMKRAGILKPLLMGLLRKNPRQRLRPAEAEQVLRRIVEGAHRRFGLGRVVPSRSPVPSLTQPDGEPAGGPDMDGIPAQRGSIGRVSLQGSPVLAGREDPRTATEETFRQAPGPRRSVLYAIVGTIVLVGGAAVPTVAFLRARDSPTVAPTTPTTTGPALRAAMGVQACLAQSASNETRVVDVGEAPDTVRYESLKNWVYHQDPEGYVLAVPVGWQRSRIDSLLCFRDPTSERAISVNALGPVPGAPADLFSQGTASWIAAADLAQYREIGITDTHYPEGSADREYTYVLGDVTMHGQDRLLRMKGQVFLISFVTTDFGWLTDRGLADVALVSFVAGG